MGSEMCIRDRFKVNGECVHLQWSQQKNEYTPLKANIEIECKNVPITDPKNKTIKPQKASLVAKIED